MKVVGCAAPSRALSAEAVAAGHLHLDLRRAGARRDDCGTPELVGDASSMSAGRAGEGEAGDGDCECRAVKRIVRNMVSLSLEVSVHVSVPTSYARTRR